MREKWSKLMSKSLCPVLLGVAHPALAVHTPRKAGRLVGRGFCKGSEGGRRQAPGASEPNALLR